MTQGEFEKRLKEYLESLRGVAAASLYVDLKKVVEEAKKEFPLDTAVWGVWANSEKDEPFRRDHAEMIKWFIKWFGREEPHG